MNFRLKNNTRLDLILVYVVLSVIVYELIYYIFIGSNQGLQKILSQKAKISPTVALTKPSLNQIMIKIDKTLGEYLADSKGKTLYTYDKDTIGVSNCTGECSKSYPPFYSTGTVINENNLSVIIRVDGTKQYAWRLMPLYHFTKDLTTEDVKGENVNGFWHIVKPK